MLILSHYTAAVFVSLIFPEIRFSLILTLKNYIVTHLGKFSILQISQSFNYS